MNLAEWRLKRNTGEPLTLPSGLDVMVREVGMMDLAETGNIPAPLMAMIDQVQDTKKVKADDFKTFSELLDITAISCMISPKAVAEPLEMEADNVVYVKDLSFSDRMFIFNWANREAIAVEPFRKEQGEPVEVVQPE